LPFQCRTSVAVLSNACVLLVLECTILFWLYAPVIPESFWYCGLYVCTCRIDTPYFCLLTSYACYIFCKMDSIFHKRTQAWPHSNTPHLEFLGAW